jgi:protein-L-isoaspartate(D-aspartate) O-methyltransferase
MFRQRRPASNLGMAELVAALEREGLITNPEVERAFLAADRALFLPSVQRDRAYADAPQSIGHEQTISAPHMVAIMAEAIEARPGMKVLEVGGGSGWHAAVLASLVRPGGHVFSMERIPALAVGARESLAAAGFADAVSVIVGDGSLGYAPEAPYDRISVAAAAPRVPKPLVAQLKPDGGRLLVPVGPPSHQELIEVRVEGGAAKQRSLGGCVFVPLLGAEGY